MNEDRSLRRGAMSGPFLPFTAQYPTN